MLSSSSEREREIARVRLSGPGDEKKENLEWEQEWEVKVAIILCALARDKIFAQEWHSVDKIRFENERMPGNEQRQRNCRKTERGEERDANTIPSNGGKNLKQNKANRGRAGRGESREQGLSRWVWILGWQG